MRSRLTCLPRHSPVLRQYGADSHRARAELLYALGEHAQAGSTRKTGREKELLSLACGKGLVRAKCTDLVDGMVALTNEPQGRRVAVRFGEGVCAAARAAQGIFSIRVALHCRTGIFEKRCRVDTTTQFLLAPKELVGIA